MTPAALAVLLLASRDPLGVALCITLLRGPHVAAAAETLCMDSIMAAAFRASRVLWLNVNQAQFSRFPVMERVAIVRRQLKV